MMGKSPVKGKAGPKRSIWVDLVTKLVLEQAKFFCLILPKVTFKRSKDSIPEKAIEIYDEMRWALHMLHGKSPVINRHRFS